MRIYKKIAGLEIVGLYLLGKVNLVMFNRNRVLYTNVRIHGQIDRLRKVGLQSNIQHSWAQPSQTKPSQAKPSKAKLCSAQLSTAQLSSAHKSTAQHSTRRPKYVIGLQWQAFSLELNLCENYPGHSSAQAQPSKAQHSTPQLS